MVGEELCQSRSIFNRHLNTRWLTLVPALKKVEGWDTTKTEIPSERTVFQKNIKKGMIHQSLYNLRNETEVLIQIAVIVDTVVYHTRILYIFSQKGQ